MDSIEIWRSAAALVLHYKTDASERAALRALALRNAGDLDGFSEWCRIGSAVLELQRARPDVPDLIN